MDVIIKQAYYCFMKQTRNKLVGEQPRSELGTFKAIGEPMGVPVCVSLPLDIDRAVRGLPKRSEWMRRVLTEAAERELLGSGNGTDP